MTHRGQAPWGVLPSAMQREQPISLVRSLCALIEHRVAGSRVVLTLHFHNYKCSFKSPLMLTAHNSHNHFDSICDVVCSYDT